MQLQAAWKEGCQSKAFRGAKGRLSFAAYRRKVAKDVKAFHGVAGENKSEQQQYIGPALRR